jgi:hypothetical protein
LGCLCLLGRAACSCTNRAGSSLRVAGARPFRRPVDCDKRT